jgi:hypothetical protein
VTLVTAPGCHLCDDAQEVLRALLRDGAPIQLDIIDATSAEGRSLLTVHRPAMNPLVLVDGAYFSAGRLPRRKFRALLAHRGTTLAEAARNG